MITNIINDEQSNKEIEVRSEQILAALQGLKVFQAEIVLRRVESRIKRDSILPDSVTHLEPTPTSHSA